VLLYWGMGKEILARAADSHGVPAACHRAGHQRDSRHDEFPGYLNRAGELATCAKPAIARWRWSVATFAMRLSSERTWGEVGTVTPTVILYSRSELNGLEAVSEM
jgi:hypothetical protein